MPFFYSQYLRGDRRGSQSRINAHPSPHIPGADGASPPSPPPILKSNPINPITGLPRPSAGRLVRTSARRSSARSSARFKPLKYSADRKKKVVHFATIEVQPFHFDWRCADDVFFTRVELAAMGKGRFDDATALRQRRQTDEEGDEQRTVDDAGISIKPTTHDIAALLAMAFEDDDVDENMSIRGIEHFVYPALQQEMIRRKKQVQREVLDFARSDRLDPQGWRLAELSRALSQWARNVAMEKGVQYCLHASELDPDQALDPTQLQRFNASRDDVDQLTRSIMGSTSFGNERSRTVGAQPSPFWHVPSDAPHDGGALDAAAGDAAGRPPRDKLQPPGASTGEG